MKIISSLFRAVEKSGMMATKKRVYPAADRNKEPILSVLKDRIRPGANQTLLEISSGTGQHVAHFAPNFPQVTFYPSEFETSLLESIAAHSHDFTNIHPPFHIDVTTDCKSWGNGIFKESSLDYIYNANLIHISPYECTVGLFENAGKLLKPNGILFTYGPYAIDGKITPASNVGFDRSLRSQDPKWGLRDVKDLEKLAKSNGIDLIEIIDMPANNKTIVWVKTSNR